MIIDADLQDPPEAIPALLEQWRAGFKVVHASRQGAIEPNRRRRFATTAFYRMFNLLSEITIDPRAGDFMLLDRKVVETFLALPERHRFNRGLIIWAGFRKTTIPVAREFRHAGSSKWGSVRLIRHAVYAVMSFGSFPLRVWTYLGAVVSALALVLGLVVIIRTLIFGADVPGFPTLIVAVLFSTGVQLIGLGMIGEYVGKIFAEVKRRPLYAIGDEVGFEDNPDEGTASGAATLA